MDATQIVDVLLRELPGEPARFEAVHSADGMPTVYVDRDALVEASRVLRDAPELRFSLLIDITAVDYYPREPRYEVLYLLVCIGWPGYGDRPARLRMKVRVPGESAHLPTVQEIWPAAGWAEREVYDFFGVEFDAHPDLRRILMPDDWDGFPLRKDYPVQIKAPVKTAWPLQVSEEEFLANIEAARAQPRDT